VSDEDLPETTSHVRYEWDCPECGDVNDWGDIEPQGVEECEFCGSKVRIR
jgi:hypothetical protein